MQKLKESSKFLYLVAIVFIAIGIIYKDIAILFWTCIGVGATLCVVVFILRYRVRMIERKIEEDEKKRKMGIKKD